jgi:Mrp family chromosome partitioning ATPase
MKMGAIRQFLSDVDWGELDYMVVDLPPGTGDEPLSVVQLMKKVDGAIVVTTPQELALVSARKAVNFSQVLKVPVIGIIENMSGFVCPYCGKEINIFKYGGGERAAIEMGVPFLGRVPFDPKMVEAADNGTPFVLQRDSKVSKAFVQIVEQVRAFAEGREVKG